jgi:hypothetical protein
VHRAISSAVERFVHIEDVSGSNPLSPTIHSTKDDPSGSSFAFLALPERGAKAKGANVLGD